MTKPKDSPAERLAEAGRALYGERWQEPLAEDIGVNRRTIRRWLNGDTPLPADHGIFRELRDFMTGRAREIERARDRLP